MEHILYRFDEALTGGYNCLLLGDVYTLQAFQREKGLGEDLQTALATTAAGDEVVGCGAMVYLGDMQNSYNEGFTLLFNLGGKSYIETAPDAKVLHQATGYLIHIIQGALWSIHGPIWMALARIKSTNFTSGHSWAAGIRPPLWVAFPVCKAIRCGSGLPCQTAITNWMLLPAT